nr:YHYH protein [Amylibacter sp.]
MRRPKFLFPIAVATLLAAPTLSFAHEGSPETDLFDKNALSQPVEFVECTLENGDTAQCARTTTRYKPANLDIGPFCPATLEDAGGIWEWDGKDAGLYRVDGDFLKMLAGLGYKMYDDDGSVFTSDISKAQPTQDHTCISVSPDESVVITTLIPVSPVMADTPTSLGVVGKVGMALNGVPIFSDAPSVLHTGHMPALDTCGGHIDPGGWYHWHATSTDIQTAFKTEDVDAVCALPQDPGAQFGFAFDGFPIYGSLDSDHQTPTNLDACNGHIGMTKDFDAPIYHYHASTDFPNLPPCLVGVQAQDNFATTAQVGIGAHPTEGTDITRNDPPGGGGPRGMPPGFDSAAETLGVTGEKLMQVLQANGGPRLDFAKAATDLGVTEQALRDALPPPPNR